MLRSTLPVLAFTLAVSFADVAAAQCTNPWLAENTASGVTGQVHALLEWDRDGAGPLPAVWVLGGEFTSAGSISASRIVAYDPATRVWMPLGAGVNGIVRALAAMPNGDLIAGGEFSTAGGIPTNCVARWNGIAWSPMGSGFDASVRSLLVRPNGTLVAGGIFTDPSNPGLRGIAEWNGTAWTSVGAGFAFASVFTMATMPNGDLIAAGAIMLGSVVQYVVRWNGTTWAPLGTAVAPPSSIFFGMDDLLVLQNGDVVLCGNNAAGVAGGSGRLARWNGTTWSAMPQPLNTPFALAQLSGGDIVAAGSGPAVPVSRWNGSSWSTLGAPLSPTPLAGIGRAALALPGDQLLVGGSLTSGPDITDAALWDSTDWRPLGEGGWTGSDLRVTGRPDGSLVVAMYRNPISYLGLRNASGWTSLGTATQVLALATMPNGDVVAGGRFSFIGGSNAGRIARWNGSSWSPIGGGIGTSAQPDYVAALAVAPDGSLIAGGRFATAGGGAANNVARFDGTSWSPLGAGMPGPVAALTVTPDGDVIAGGNFPGSFSNPFANVARWNGTAWLPIGPGLDQQVIALTARPDGSIAAAGLFSLPGPPPIQFVPQVALWTNAWTMIGQISSSVYTLATLVNGDLVVGGSFQSIDGVPRPGIARWNGTAWSGFGSSQMWVQDMALVPNGDLAVVGGFTHAGGVPSPQVARLSTTCPASVTNVGAGCTGSGGTLALTAMSLPWLGATFRSRATGLGANAIALEVLGFSSIAVPMPAILPQGVPGCDLTTAPDLLIAHLPSGGVVDLAMPLPNTMVFAGTTLYQQVAALELGPTFDIQALVGSNSLRLVEGFF